MVLNHFDAFSELSNPGYLARPVQVWLERFGNLGVAVFYALSGFLLFRAFVRAFARRAGFPRLAPYFLRRVVRIYPAYWVALFVFVVLMGEGQMHTILDGVTFFGLIQNYRYGYLPLGMFTAWTLVIEMSFYVVLPLIAWSTERAAARARRPQSVYLVTCFGLAGIGVAARAWSLWVVAPRRAATGSWFRLDHVDQWLLGYLDWFAVGMVLAVLSVVFPGASAAPRAIAERVARHTWVPWTGAVVAFWLVIRLDFPRLEFVGFTDAQIFWRGVLLPIAAALLLLPMVFGTERGGWGRRTMASRPLRALGTVSYGIYLWHLPVLRELEQWSQSGDLLHDPWVRLVVVMVATLALATASYWAIERPLMRWARRAVPA